MIGSFVPRYESEEPMSNAMAPRDAVCGVSVTVERNSAMAATPSIEKVTKADVLRAAQESIKPANLTVVAVGKPEEFGKPLTALGTVTPVDLTIPEPKRAPAKSNAVSLKGEEANIEKVYHSIASYF